MIIQNLLPSLTVCIFLIIQNFMPQVARAGEHVSRLEKLFSLHTPNGSGPFPAVALVPGCSGFKWEFYDRAESKLVDMGFVTIRVDSLRARKLGSCSRVSVDTASEDIFLALNYLAGIDFVKASSVNLLGWSFGGGVVLQALAKLDQHPNVQLASVAAFSPKCLGVDPWSASVPVLMLLGSADNVTPPKFCRELVGMSDVATSVMIEEYNGAHHGFDDEDLPPKKQFSFGTMGYHPVAAKKSWQALEAFLVR